MEEDLNDLEIKAYEREDLIKQYQNIKNILEKINEKIKSNLDYVEKFRIKSGEKQKNILFVIQKELDEGLELNDSEVKEIQFCYDASFYYVFEFISIPRFTQSFITKFFIFLLFLVLLPLSLGGLLIAGITALAFNAGKKLVDKISRFRDEEAQQKNLLMENENKDDNIVYKSLKKDLKFDVYKEIELEFSRIKKIDIVKFLLFIDFYLSNEFWSKKIYQIIRSNFKNIFETKFNESINIFRRRITSDNYEEMKKSLLQIFREFWYQCLKDILILKNKKDYNEETGINSIEHLIRKFNPKEITEEIIEKTFKQILKYKLINQEGFANKKLFKELFTQNEEQKFAINITTKIEKEELSDLSKLKEFVIKGVDIPNVSSYSLDLMNYYKKKKVIILKNKKRKIILYL